MRVLGALAASICLFACGDGEELRAFSQQHRAEILAALEPYAAAPRLLEATPAFDAPRLLVASLDAVPDFRAKGNAMVLHLEDLRELGAPGNPPVRLEGRGYAQGWTAPDSWAHLAVSGEWRGPILLARRAPQALESLAAQRFALVLREVRFQPASEASGPAAVTGDAVLVDLKAGRVVGGFPFSVVGGAAPMSSSPNDLAERLAQAVSAGVQRLAPGCTPPYLERSGPKARRLVR
ncbi:MAG: hypothetical protein AB1938_27760 [Myxococcota bacterium]